MRSWTKFATTTSAAIFQNAKASVRSSFSRKWALCTHQTNTALSSSLKISYVRPSFMSSARFVKGFLSAIEILFQLFHATNTRFHFYTEKEHFPFALTNLNLTKKVFRTSSYNDYA